MSFYTTKISSLWNESQNEVTITAYLPHIKQADCAIIILPGGAYCFRAEHEGAGYAEFLAEHGITAFVVAYRCTPNRFPLPLMDARRGVQFVRHHAKEYGIDPHKIALMGSSAGGHLAALTCTCHMEFPIENPDGVDLESYLPDAQILCYPVIKLLGNGITHLDSGRNLLGMQHAELGEALSPDLIVTDDTPPAFIWHTFEDSAVNVINSLDYTRALKKHAVPTELHIFPYGHHGLGLCKDRDTNSKHASSWTKLLLNWLNLIGFTYSHNAQIS